MAKEKTVYQRVVTEGGAPVARQGLGEMPLTLWVLVAGVILYLYIRRASLGIDTHPGEGKPVLIGPPQPKVFIGPPAPLGYGPYPVNPGSVVGPTQSISAGPLPTAPAATIGPVPPIQQTITSPFEWLNERFRELIGATHRGIQQ